MILMRVIYTDYPDKKCYFFSTDSWDYEEYMCLLEKDVYVKRKFNSLGYVNDTPSFYFNAPEEELIFLLEFGNMMSEKAAYI